MQPTSPYIKALSVLHYALLGGQVMFTFIFILVLSIGKNYEPALSSWAQPVLLVCAIIAILAYFVSYSFYKRKLEGINSSSDTASQKLEIYRGVNITRWAIMQFATLLCIILFFVTANFYILIVVAVMLLLFFSVRPSTSKVMEDLSVSESDLQNAAVNISGKA